MSEMERILDALHAHEGVRHVLLLGRDGLLVHHQGEGRLDLDVTSAMVPEILGAARRLGDATDAGEMTTTAMEFEDGVMVVAPVSEDLVLTALLRRGVGFAGLLREIRDRRGELAAAV